MGLRPATPTTDVSHEGIPGPLRPYLDRLATTLEEELGTSLAGVYAIGSLALGDWTPGHSDVDVVVVAEAPLRKPTLCRVAESLDHSRLPVPVRKLELVVYERDSVSRGDATFAMNLNTGAGIPTTVDLDASRVPRFWFVLDLAIAHGRAIALRGPPSGEPWAAPSEDEIRPALAEGLRWYADHGGDPRDTLLASSRAWHHLRTGGWTGKTAAAGWAAGELRAEEPDLAAAVEAAAAARATGLVSEPDPSTTEAADRLLRRVLTAFSGSGHV